MKYGDLYTDPALAVDEFMETMADPSTAKRCCEIASRAVHALEHIIPEKEKKQHACIYAYRLIKNGCPLPPSIVGLIAPALKDLFVGREPFKQANHRPQKNLKHFKILVQIEFLRLLALPNKRFTNKAMELVAPTWGLESVSDIWKRRKEIPKLHMYGEDVSYEERAKVFLEGRQPVEVIFPGDELDMVLENLAIEAPDVHSRLTGLPLRYPDDD